MADDSTRDEIPEWRQPWPVQVNNLRRRIIQLEAQMRGFQEVREDTGLFEASVEERRTLIIVTRWFLRWHDALDALVAWWIKYGGPAQDNRVQRLPRWVAVAAIAAGVCTMGTFLLAVATFIHITL